MHDPKMVEMVARAMAATAHDNPEFVAPAYRSAAKAALDALAAAGWQHVLEGWVAVPKKPSDDQARRMVYAAHYAIQNEDDLWQAMLAAAPRAEDQA